MAQDFSRCAETVHTLLAGAEARFSAVGIDTARLDAEALLAHALTLDRAQLFARLRDGITTEAHGIFLKLVQRRARREPLAYIIGVREFWSLAFHITPAVLIPRPETELLVETSLRILAEAQLLTSPLRLLDIGTGSGCLAIALAKELPRAEVWAVDLSLAALAVAQDNAQRLGVAARTHFLHSDLFSAFSQTELRFDLLVANPPYIACGEIATLQPEVRDWEPHLALVGGTDGLDFYRRLLTDSPRYVRSGGRLLMEIGTSQAASVLDLFRHHATFANSSCLQDYAGHDRVVVAYAR